VHRRRLDALRLVDADLGLKAVESLGVRSARRSIENRTRPG